MIAFKIRGLTPSNAVFKNLAYRRLVFSEKALDPSNMVGTDGVVSLREPGWYQITVQTYWHPPAVETSCYVTLNDVGTGEVLAVGNKDNPPGQHPAIGLSDLIYSDGTRKIEIKARWISTVSKDPSATHSMQTSGAYVFAFGNKVI